MSHVSPVEFGFPAEPEIDRHQHQCRAMGERDRERPKPQLRRRYPRQRSWMAPVGQPIKTEGDDEEAGADLYRALPFDHGNQQREGQDHEQHREQMADRERPKRGHQGARAPFHQSRGNGERPPHARVDAVVEAARDHSQPEPGRRPVGCAHIQTDG
jgi:hypothetical protein